MSIKTFMGNNSDALLQFGAGLLAGRTAPEQLGLGVSGFAQARRDGKTRNATMEWLRVNNPEIGSLVETGAISPADAVKMAWEQKNRSEKPQNPFMSAGGSLYNWQTGEWVQPPGGAGGGSEYGLAPQYGVDKDGNPVIIQLSKDGTAKQTALPEGVQLSKQPIKMDAGTEFILLDPITRQPVGRIPKDLAGAEREKVLGENEGKRIAAAPGDLQTANNAISLIDTIRKDPGKGIGTGFSSFGNRVRGTPGYDFENKVKQLKSGAFLQAIEQMRGLGALSNTEGEAATAALNRLDTATSQEEFDAALNDYESIVRQGQARAQQIINGQGQGQVQNQPQVRKRYNPATGRVE